MSKPIDLSQVIPALLNLLSAECTVRSFGAPAPQEPERLIEEESRILQRFGGNRALFARLMARFRPEVERHLTELRHHLAAADVTALTAVLHSFKGVAANMGASALAAALARLEHALKGDAQTDCRQLLDAAAMDALARLAEQSTLSLLALVDPEPARAAPPPSPGSAHDRHREQLLQLKSMLAAGDLRAVNVVEILSAARPEDHRLQALASQIQSLDFASAVHTLHTLIQARDP